MVKREAFNDYEVEFDDLKPQRVSQNSEESMINYNDNYDDNYNDNYGTPNDDYDDDYIESTTNFMDVSTEKPLVMDSLEKKRSEGKEKLVKKPE